MRYLKNYRSSDIKIERPEVLRYLAYRKREKEICPMVKEIMEQQIDLAYSLIEPMGIYSILNNISLKEHRIFKDAEKIAFGICTIGSKLEKKVEEYFVKGEYLEGLVLDAAGTVAVEDLAKLINAEIDKKACEMGFRTSRRFSPGQGNWQLDGQYLIFKHLNAETLGIKIINKSYMMIPRKSVSFAHKLSKKKVEEVRLEDCRYCNLYKHCAYRRGH